MIVFLWLFIDKTLIITINKNNNDNQYHYHTLLLKNDYRTYRTTDDSLTYNSSKINVLVVYSFIYIH